MLTFNPVTSHVEYMISQEGLALIYVHEGEVHSRNKLIMGAPIPCFFMEILLSMENMNRVELLSSMSPLEKTSNSAEAVISGRPSISILLNSCTC